MDVGSHSKKLFCSVCKNTAGGGVNAHGLGLDESIAKTNSNYFPLSFPVFTAAHKRKDYFISQNEETAFPATAQVSYNGGLPTQRVSKATPTFHFKLIWTVALL